MYDIWDGMNAVFGQTYGLEVVNYFALPGEPRFETPSFRRSNAWEAVRQEVQAVRNGVGITGKNQPITALQRLFRRNSCNHRTIPIDFYHINTSQLP